ncbi:afadin- and alpha-actinin-binding protein-like isoform X2 [Paroedura picta]|uniref:afadin- and alpha-actinin-binding protein-like isoform X2 n=1 Tax=Paroedura picta TaxID=143630 RepID=UPI0040570092
MGVGRQDGAVTGLFACCLGDVPEGHESLFVSLLVFQVWVPPSRSSGRMESWLSPALLGAKTAEELSATFLAPEAAGLSQSPALGRGLPPLSCSPDLPAGLGEMGRRDNLGSCISYLNAELGALGLPALYQEDGSGADLERGFSLLALVNGTCGLLNLYRSLSAKLGDMEAEEIRRAGELEYLRTRHAKLKDQVEICKKEIVAVQNKEQQLQSRNKELNTLLRGEKDEIAKLSSALASRATQHLHDMKRKEQELTRLKEKMSQLVTEKKDRRGTIEILNVLTRPDGKRSTWKTGKSLGKKEEELYRVQLARQEQREQGLALENDRLKQLLTQVGRDVQQLMGTDGLAQCAEQNFPCEAFQEQWSRFRNVVEASSSLLPQPGNAQDPPFPSLTEPHKETLKLKEETEQRNSLASHLQQFFQEQLDAMASAELPTHLKGSCFLEEWHQLEEERAMLEEQRRAFEGERKNFTEAAIRLGREKLQFEEEKALVLKQEFLRSLPRLEIRDPKRRLSAPVAAREPDCLPSRRRRSQPVRTPYPPVVLTPGRTPLALFRTQPWQFASNPSTPARAEWHRQTAQPPSNRPLSSPRLSQRTRQDASCQTELAVEVDSEDDLLDYSTESSFLGCHVIGIQEYL